MNFKIDGGEEMKKNLVTTVLAAGMAVIGTFGVVSTLSGGGGIPEMGMTTIWWQIALFVAGLPMLVVEGLMVTVLFMGLGPLENIPEDTLKSVLVGIIIGFLIAAAIYLVVTL